jgi:hypothetical protein
MVKQTNFGDIPNDEVTNENKSEKNMKGFDMTLNVFFILAKIACSCQAGIYNEYLLNRGWIRYPDTVSDTYPVSIFEIFCSKRIIRYPKKL